MVTAFKRNIFCSTPQRLRLNSPYTRNDYEAYFRDQERVSAGSNYWARLPVFLSFYLLSARPTKRYLMDKRKFQLES